MKNSINQLDNTIAFKADIINLSLTSDYSHIIPAKGPNSLRANELDRLHERLSQESSRLVSVYDKAFEECEKHGLLVVCSAGNDGIPGIPNRLYVSSRAKRSDLHFIREKRENEEIEFK